MVVSILYYIIFFQFYLNRIFATRACVEVIFTMSADRPIAWTMNVVAIRLTNATLWQRNTIPSIIVMNHFTTHTDIIVTRRGKLK